MSPVFMSETNRVTGTVYCVKRAMLSSHMGDNLICLSMIQQGERKEEDRNPHPPRGEVESMWDDDVNH